MGSRQSSGPPLGALDSPPVAIPLRTSQRTAAMCDQYRALPPGRHREIGGDRGADPSAAGSTRGDSAMVRRLVHIHRTPDAREHQASLRSVQSIPEYTRAPSLASQPRAPGNRYQFRRSDDGLGPHFRYISLPLAAPATKRRTRRHRTGVHSTHRCPGPPLYARRASRPAAAGDPLVTGRRGRCGSAPPAGPAVHSGTALG